MLFIYLTYAFAGIGVIGGLCTFYGIITRRDNLTLWSLLLGGASIGLGMISLGISLTLAMIQKGP